MARFFSESSRVDTTDLFFAGAAKIRISPFFTCNSTSSPRPLSLSKGLGILIPLEFPIDINVVNISNYIVATYANCVKKA